MAEPVRSVAVVGRDAAACIMALGLRRALAPVGIAVTLVELPSALAPGAVHAALPSLATLHALLGLREDALYARCGAVPVMGQQFAGWSDVPFVRGYDQARAAINDVDFLQFWSLARRSGMRVPLEDFSPGAAAAKQGRIGGGKPRDGRDPPAYGWHLDARAYAALLREGCAAAGVVIVSADAVAVERDGERVRALRLADGTAVEADLYVDASGEERVLIGQDGFESWSHWFPAARAITATLPRLDPPPAFARVVATRAGWVGLFPLQDHVALAGHVAAEQDVAELLAEAGAGAAQSVSARPFAPGVLQRSWVGNVVAVGDAAAALERIDAVELHLIQIALSTLVAWWPVRRDAMPEAAEYDRAVAAHIGNIRDFQLAHYALATRAQPFWQAARAAPLPEPLTARLNLFAARGIAPPFDDETFQPQDWAAILAGHGVVPESSDPAVDRTPQDEQIGKIQRLLQIVAGEVRAMPTMAEFLAARTAR